MYYSIIKHYLEPTESHHMMPLAVDVIAPDYYLHLIAARDGQWYAIAETDYMPGLRVVEDIEAAFPVTVRAWRVLAEHQANADATHLPVSALRMESAKEWADEHWETFKKVAYRDNGWTSVFLQVEPLEGIGYGDFGLTFYANGAKQ